MEHSSIDSCNNNQDETKNSKDPTTPVITDLPTPTSPEDVSPIVLKEEKEDDKRNDPVTPILENTIDTSNEDDKFDLEEGTGSKKEGDGVVGRMKTQIFRIFGRPTSQCQTDHPHQSHTIQKRNNKPSLVPPAPPSPTKKQNRPSPADNIYIDGRRYQNYNRIYTLPNDDIEIDRLLNNHFLVKHSFGSNYSAPVTEILSSDNSKSCTLGGFRTGTVSPQCISSISSSTTPTSRSPCGGDSGEPLKHCSSNDSSGMSLTTFQTGSSSHSTTSLSNYFRKLTTLGHRHKDVSHHSLLSSIQQTSIDSPTAPTPTATTTRTTTPTTSPVATRTTTRTASPVISPAETPTSSPPPPPLSKSTTTRTMTCPDESTQISSQLSQRRSYSESDLKLCQYQQQSKSESCHVYPNINVTRVLDVACGSGVWILEMAHDFPKADFYGFDLSEMFPTAIRPSNTFFSLFDMSCGFPYPDEYFDFIRMHDVHTCFPSTDTEFIMREIRRCLKPGGYTELREMDFIICDPGPITAMFTSTDSLTATELQKHYGVDIKWPRMIRKFLTMIKLADIHSRAVPLIYSNHSQQDTSVDKMCYRYWNDRFDAYRRLFWQIYGGSDDFKTHHELDKRIQQMMTEMLDRSSYCQYYMAWGRKPLVEEEHSNTRRRTLPTHDDNGRYLKLHSNNNKVDANGEKTSRPNVPRTTSDTYGHEISEFTDGFTD